MEMTAVRPVRRARWLMPIGDAAEEKRSEKRAAIALDVVYAVDGGIDRKGRTVDVSSMSSAIEPTDGFDPPEGANVIARIEHLGMVRGRILRRQGRRFVIVFSDGERTRAKFETRIEALVADGSTVRDESRRFERIVPFRRLVEVETEGGKRMMRIKDVSRSGVALENEARPAIGSRIRIGSRPAATVRHMEDGFAVNFDVEIAAGEFGHAVIL